MWAQDWQTLMPLVRPPGGRATYDTTQLLVRAGYDPTEAEKFWTRMSQGGGNAPPEFLSTHPSDETRIQQIRDLLPEALAEYRGQAPQP